MKYSLFFVALMFSCVAHAEDSRLVLVCKGDWTQYGQKKILMEATATAFLEIADGAVSVEGVPGFQTSKNGRPFEIIKETDNYLTIFIFA